jgi:hypothetical protein
MGFGLWDKKSVATYARSIQKVEIITSTNTRTLTNQADILPYFKKTRGVFRQTMVVDIK